MSQPSVKPVYVLHGDDEYLRDEARKTVLAAALAGADPQTCLGAYDAETELATVLDDLRTLPFLAPHRVVLVSQADGFISKHRDGLEKYLEAPSATGTLVLMTSAWPSNTRLYKLVAKIGESIDCGVPDKQDLSRWIAQAAAKRGKKISPPAAQLLGQWVGRDLASLDGEIEKLSLYAADRAEITEQDVSDMVVSSAGPGAFDLTNAITAGDAAGALRTLAGMLSHRGEEFKVLGLVRWHLVRALAAQQAIAGGTPPDRAVPFMPFAQKKAFETMLRRRNLGKLLGDFRRMLKADLAMKSGTEAQAAMQELVVGLCK